MEWMLDNLVRLLFIYLWSGYFLFDYNCKSRQNMIDKAKRRWNAGTMINLMYHSCNRCVSYIFYTSNHPIYFAVDETMAPLDPRSKSQVMSKLEAFCIDSIVSIGNLPYRRFIFAIV